MNEASARAFPNIALVKYWGKQDTSLILPVAGMPHRQAGDDRTGCRAGAAPGQPAQCPGVEFQSVGGAGGDRQRGEAGC